MYGDSSLPSSSTAPSGLSCCCNVVVVVYHWTSDANLCFALALCPLLVVVHILLLPCSSTPPSVPPFIVSVWSVTFYFTLFIFYFFIFILTSLSPSPSLLPFPFPSPSPLSLLVFFLTLVMSALACFGVTNHPLRNLRAKSKHPPTQKPCITIGCRRRPTLPSASSCVSTPWPVLPWLAAASSCPLCDWLCWWRTV